MTTAAVMPASIDEVQDLLRKQNYISDRGLAIPVFLALTLQRPLFLEGEAGVGKTEIARVLASALDTRLIHLQCYEGLDVNHAVYEWNHTSADTGDAVDGAWRRRGPRGRSRRPVQ